MAFSRGGGVMRARNFTGIALGASLWGRGDVIEAC